MSIASTCITAAPRRRGIGAQLAMTALALTVAGAFLLWQAGQGRPEPATPLAGPAPGVVVAAARVSGADPLTRELEALTAADLGLAAQTPDPLTRELEALAAEGVGAPRGR